MMKVLIINSMSGTGSTGKIVDGIADVLIDQGHDVKIAYGYGTARHPKAECFGSHRSQTFHKIMSHAFDMQGLWSKDDTKNLIEKIKKFKPDIINLHNLHGNYLNYPLLFSFLKDYPAKVVWTLHDCWSFTGHCPHFVFIGCEKWKTECHNCPQLKMYPASDFWDGSRRNFRKKKSLFSALGTKLTIVAVSEWLGGLAKQSFLGKCEIKVIHNGTNPYLFQPAEPDIKNSIREKYRLGSSKVVIAVAAPWSKRKGFDDLMILSKKLRPDFTMVIVGLNEAQLAGIPPHVVGIKRTENIRELAALYSVAAVLVNPTYEDCFPTVNLEALSCGTPVVTYLTGGSPEAIDSTTGIVVEQGDIDGLASAIGKVCSSHLDFQSEQCRERVLKEFNFSEAYIQYVNLFEDLIK